MYLLETNQQIIEKVYDRNVSEHTVHHSLLIMGWRRSRSFRVPIQTPAHQQPTIGTWIYVDIWNNRSGPWSSGRTWSGLMDHVDLWQRWP